MNPLLTLPGLLRLAEGIPATPDNYRGLGEPCRHEDPQGSIFLPEIIKGDM